MKPIHRPTTILVACLALGVVFTESPSHAKSLPQESSWTSHRLPAPSGSEGKPFAAEAATCPAAAVCYVVGDSFDDFSGGAPAVEELSPHGWTVSGLNGTDPDDSSITQALSCSSADVCAGGGSYGPGDNLSDGYATSTVLWMKSGWHISQAPLPSAGLGGGAIVDSSCVNAGFCVGVGNDYSYYGSGASNGSISHGLIERYSNGSWQPQQAPLPPGSSNKDDTALSRVLCRSVGTCIAIGGDGSWPIGNSGQSTIYSLSHGHWSRRLAPTPPGAHGVFDVQLNSIGCPPSGPCVIVGSYATGSNANPLLHPLLLSRVGSAWQARTLRTAKNYGVSPERVVCPAARLCVASGAASRGGRMYFTGFIYSGGKWSEEVVPYPNGAFVKWNSWDAVYGVSGMACVSTKSCLAVGLGNPYQMTPSGQGGWSLAYVDGRWSIQRIPAPAGVSEGFPLEIVGVSRKGSGYVAVGNFFAEGRYAQSPQGMVAFYK